MRWFKVPDPWNRGPFPRTEVEGLWQDSEDSLRLPCANPLKGAVLASSESCWWLLPRTTHTRGLAVTAGERNKCDRMIKLNSVREQVRERCAILHACSCVSYTCVCGRRSFLSGKAWVAVQPATDASALAYWRQRVTTSFRMIGAARLSFHAVYPPELSEGDSLSFLPLWKWLLQALPLTLPCLSG